MRKPGWRNRARTLRRRFASRATPTRHNASVGRFSAFSPAPPSARLRTVQDPTVRATPLHPSTPTPALEMSAIDRLAPVGCVTRSRRAPSAGHTNAGRRACAEFAADRRHRRTTDRCWLRPIAPLDDMFARCVAAYEDYGGDWNRACETLRRTAAPFARTVRPLHRTTRAGPCTSEARPRSCSERAS